MKILLISLLISMSSILGSYGQSTWESTGKKNEFFASLAKQLRYPATARETNKVAKAYVFFSIDDLGKIDNVSILNASNVDTQFVAEIMRVMSSVPTQDQSSAGSYVLPIQFQLEGESRIISPKEENSAFVKFISEKPLLSEVVVVGYTKS